MDNNNILEYQIKSGDTVEFYDCDTAIRDKDCSGENPKYYITGEVIYVYKKQSYFGWENHLCSIRTPNGRISRGHFVSAVKLIKQKQN
jgi:hypothetical protein